MRAMLLLVCTALGCTHAAPTTASESPVMTPVGSDASAVRPMKLRYHGEHRGDHPSWIYTVYVAVEADTRAGQAVWRRTYRFEQISPPVTGPAPRMDGVIVFAQKTLVPLEADSTFFTHRSQLTFLPDRLEATDIEGDGQPTRSTVPVQDFVVTDVWLGLDLYVLGLPSKAGYQTRMHILDDAPRPPRPFSVSVDRIERVRVPAGEFDGLRIRVDPLDGDDRMRSIYHVRLKAPRLVLRKEYVVNPRTEGAMKRSTGIEELEAIDAVEPPLK